MLGCSEMFVLPLQFLTKQRIAITLLSLRTMIQLTLQLRDNSQSLCQDLKRQSRAQDSFRIVPLPDQTHLHKVKVPKGSITSGKFAKPAISNLVG